MSCRLVKGKWSLILDAILMDASTVERVDSASTFPSSGILFYFFAKHLQLRGPDTTDLPGYLKPFLLRALYCARRGRDVHTRWLALVALGAAGRLSLRDRQR